MKGRLLRNPDVIWRDEPTQREMILEALERGEDASSRGWVVLVDRGQVHELNLMAGEIWCLADGSRDARAVAEDLACRYDAAPDEILADVEGFVTASVARGWLLLKA